MTNIIKREIEKFLSKKTIYYSKFSIELIKYLKKRYPTLPTLKSQWYMLKNNLTIVPICKFPGCKNDAKWNEVKQRFHHGCSMDHNKRITSLKNFGTYHPNQSKKQLHKVKASMKEKYGVEFITQTSKHKNSVRKSVREKYGVDNILQSPEIREKIKKTNLERYGVEECIASPEIREKARQTNLKRYGVEETLSSPEIREKGNKTNMARYGSIFPMRNEELLERRRQTIIEKYDSYSVFSDETVVNKYRKTAWTKYYNNKLIHNKFVKPLFELDEYNGTKNYQKYQWQCKKCATVFKDNVSNGHTPQCPQCFPKDLRISNAETELFEMITVDNKLQTNRNLIENYEIDIYLPDYKIGIEYNGMYWHSEQKGIDKYYHLNKTLLSENNGFFLIHIFESEWINRPLQTISLIERHIGIFDEIIDVNDIDIRILREDETNFFLSTTTLFFTESIFEKRIGAFYDNKLVAIMTLESFKEKSIINKFYEKMGIGFDGNIFELLLNSFDIESNKPIHYYPDRRYTKTDDKMLLESGFTFEGGTEPNLIYSKNMSHILSHTVTKNNILNFVNEYDENLNIYENMIFNGYLSIWDCGKLVFKKM